MTLIVAKPADAVKCFVLLCGTDEYIQKKKQFFIDNPNVKVLEEIKNVMVGVVQSPRMPGLGFTPKPEYVITVQWVVWYQESEIKN